MELFPKFFIIRHQWGMKGKARNFCYNYIHSSTQFRYFPFGILRKYSLDENFIAKFFSSFLFPQRQLYIKKLDGPNAFQTFLAKFAVGTRGV